MSEISDDIKKYRDGDLYEEKSAGQKELQDLKTENLRLRKGFKFQENVSEL